MNEVPRPEVLRELAQIAGRLTGFRSDAVSEEALARFLSQERRQGHDPGDLLAGLRGGDRAAAERLIGEVMVAETFFFRHPEHFDLICQEVIPEILSAGEPPRIWSAGCASGEETYSLAACVVAVGMERAHGALVLGTDLSVARLAQARRGEYRSWSVRDAGPMVVPALERLPNGKWRVQAEVAAITRFQTHNLLDAPPEPGQFDAVFCRNVLMYLDAAPARMVRANLAAALRPGGWLFLGPLEGGEPIAWMVPMPGRPDVLRRVAEPFHELFLPTPRPRSPMPRPPLHRTPRPPTPPHRAAAQGHRTPIPPPRPIPSAPPPREAGAAPRAPEIEAHCSALALVEQGDLGQARAALRSLHTTAPSYLPGVVDLALVSARLGHGGEAVRTMREALVLAGALPADAVVQGPEPLPVEYYRAVAKVFLEQRRGGL